MKDLIAQENTTEIVSTAAIPTSADREKLATANLYAYAGPELRRANKALKDDDIVHSDKDLLLDDRAKTLAATEYISLVKLQDYINIRKEELRKTFFNTLDARELELSDDDPVWFKDAPASQLPGEIDVPSNGIKFQRTAGSPQKQVIDMKALQKAHPRIFKSFMKERVIPAVEEKTIEYFDEDAFIEKAKKNPEMRKFISTKYSTPRFTARNIFDE